MRSSAQCTSGIARRCLFLGREACTEADFGRPGARIAPRMGWAGSPLWLVGRELCTGAVAVRPGARIVPRARIAPRPPPRKNGAPVQGWRPGARIAPRTARAGSPLWLLGRELCTGAVPVRPGARIVPRTPPQRAGRARGDERGNARGVAWIGCHPLHAPLTERRPRARAPRRGGGAGRPPRRSRSRSARRGRRRRRCGRGRAPR